MDGRSCLPNFCDLAGQQVNGENVFSSRSLSRTSKLQEERKARGVGETQKSLGEGTVEGMSSTRLVERKGAKEVPKDRVLVTALSMCVCIFPSYVIDGNSSASLHPGLEQVTLEKGEWNFTQHPSTPPAALWKEHAVLVEQERGSEGMRGTLLDSRRRVPSNICSVFCF